MTVFQQPLNRLVAGMDSLLFGIKSANVDETLVQYTSVSLTSAQILAMYTTPVVLIAGQTGKTIVIDRILFRLDAGTQYTSGGTVAFQYTTGPVAATGTMASTVVTSATDAEYLVVGAAAASVVGDGIEITNGTGVFATGTGTATVHIWYRVV